MRPADEGIGRNAGTFSSGSDLLGSANVVRMRGKLRGTGRPVDGRAAATPVDVKWAVARAVAALA